MTLIRFPYSTLKDRQLSEIPLLDIVPTYTFVAGGCVRRAVCGMSQNSDVDWFFSSETGRDNAVTVLEQQHFKCVRESGRYTEYRRDNQRVQLIAFEYYESIEKLFDTFDFTICCFAYDRLTDEIVCTPEALIDLSRRFLVPHRIKFPVATMRRVGKYQQSGFKICRGGWQSIAKSCKELDIDLITEYID